jgi:regulation of enolase protein 1 (concanavalin A-like superfamily)
MATFELTQEPIQEHVFHAMKHINLAIEACQDYAQVMSIIAALADKAARIGVMAEEEPDTISIRIDVALDSENMSSVRVELFPSQKGAVAKMMICPPESESHLN